MGDTSEVQREHPNPNPNPMKESKLTIHPEDFPPLCLLGVPPMPDSYVIALCAALSARPPTSRHVQTLKLSVDVHKLVDLLLLRPIN
jgi:hypothetical protein